MIELHLLCDNEHFAVISIQCINCKRETGLFLKNTIFKEMVTKYALNVIQHHVGMSWIISCNDYMKYEMDNNNHQYWLNKGPWYNLSICSRLHGSLFEDFIKHARSDRYNLIGSLFTHDKI